MATAGSIQPTRDDSIGIGLIGTGYMGKCHAMAYNSVRSVFGDVPHPRLELLCDVPYESAVKFADQFGFKRATKNWREVVNDPRVDIVCITAPNKVHREMAVAALEAGKHVHLEKPMSLTLEDSRMMASLAMKKFSENGQKTIVGYQYLKNPAFTHAVKLIREGAIGEVIHFRGAVDEDYQADGNLPWTWRATKAQAGLGTLGDLGCHLISLAHSLVGSEISSLMGEMATVHKDRPVTTKEGNIERKFVENEDVASALLRFANGVTGTISTSRSAWGRKSYIYFEVHGKDGMLIYDQERMNELRIYQNAGPVAQQAFKTILTGPSHPPYQYFCPAAGHQLGFNELKVIEVRELLHAIMLGRQASPCFGDALHHEEVIHAIAQSSLQDGKRTIVGRESYTSKL